MTREEIREWVRAQVSTHDTVTASGLAEELLSAGAIDEAFRERALLVATTATVRSLLQEKGPDGLPVAANFPEEGLYRGRERLFSIEHYREPYRVHRRLMHHHAEMLVRWAEAAHAQTGEQLQIPVVDWCAYEAPAMAAC